ncbi:hypothetical protein FOXG_18601 [Fusarium oxysporum f. sp. lycopersici 4287]|uniref:Uncharacterized protein n=1 Tax=Fusarium oxysporum f. sp. lycopersici (strain 4287 / CBS 123668 / FGSC 9935 / NRRL 34936) TaxID=426428 RepID=A0A0J9UKV7_FUSO4|nr:hypothetical protein FOXG_18601 [Fusarium oxysporum f. sp. lycopersici 4287]KNA99869.1 hypothetical protein FOXG_18601 [Fusarium oxysporum f. sp. lycopersici 4287]
MNQYFSGELCYTRQHLDSRQDKNSCRSVPSFPCTDPIERGLLKQTMCWLKCSVVWCVDVFWCFPSPSILDSIGRSNCGWLVAMAFAYSIIRNKDKVGKFDRS